MRLLISGSWVRAPHWAQSLIFGAVFGSLSNAKALYAQFQIQFVWICQTRHRDHDGAFVCGHVSYKTLSDMPWDVKQKGSTFHWPVLPFVHNSILRCCPTHLIVLQLNDLWNEMHEISARIMNHKTTALFLEKFQLWKDKKSPVSSVGRAWDS